MTDGKGNRGWWNGVKGWKRHGVRRTDGRATGWRLAITIHYFVGANWHNWLVFGCHTTLKGPSGPRQRANAVSHVCVQLHTLRPASRSDTFPNLSLDSGYNAVFYQTNANNLDADGFLKPPQLDLLSRKVHTGRVTGIEYGDALVCL